MAFIINGKLVDREHCRFPGFFLNAVDVATSRLLASVEIPEGSEADFHLEYDREKLNLPNEPHEVILICTKEAIKTARVNVQASTRVGTGMGLEERIAASAWTREGDNFVVGPQVIYFDCCCVLWALFGVYTIKGTVLHDPSGLPLPAALVEARDWDPVSHDFMGSDTTDASGNFRILVPFANFINEDAPLNRPDLQFRVSLPWTAGKDQHPCPCLDFDDDIIRWNWPNCKPITLRVPCCLAVIERVGGWAAHFDGSVPTVVTHAPFPGGRGIDSVNARAQGMNAFGINGPAEDSPFGGTVTLCGAMFCKHGVKFRFSAAKWADEVTSPLFTDFAPITPPAFSEMVYSGFTIECLPPPFDFICYPVPSKSSVLRIPDADGFYDILPNTESGCLYLPWPTGGAAYPDGKYSIMMTIKDESGCVYHSGPVTLRLDNTAPDKALTVSVADCATIKIGDIVTGTLSVTDANFHSYRLVYEGDATSGVLAERTYTGVGDTGDVAVAWSWNTAGLPACGYRLVLYGWDRTIVNDVRQEGEIGFSHQVAIVKYYCLGE